jgi:putative ABC transport system substrate-binding protein
MNTRRRWLAAGAAWPALAWTGGLHAQTTPPVVIGWMGSGTREGGQRSLNVFSEGMAALGWKMGTHYVLEERWADEQMDRVPVLAQDLAARKPAVIVSLGSTPSRALNAAAPTTPIVQADGDPVAAGLVSNLARPDGMVTGISNVTFELNQKLVELLVESRPSLRRVGFVADSTVRAHGANLANVRRAAERFRFEAVIAEMAQPQDIEPAFARLAKARAQAIVILAAAWIQGPSLKKITQLGLAQGWPVVGIPRFVASQGGLFSYGPNAVARVQRAAYYVDRILKGAKPGDLPIEQPTVFDLVLNLKTARQLGIVLPQSMLIRATEVIE